MRRFKSAGHAQRFLSAHGPINNLFRCRRHLLSRIDYRAAREKHSLPGRLLLKPKLRPKCGNLLTPPSFYAIKYANDNLVG